MRLVDINKETQSTFFRCLNPNEPNSLDECVMRMQWYENYRDRGHRAKLLILDDGEIVALCQYIPIEHSHLIGRDLLAILCIWVHGYERGVGDQQGKGYGRFIIEAIEDDARRSGAKGVAAWGLDWKVWMPVSFLLHLGYAPVDREDKVVVVWKAFSSDAEPPRLLRLTDLPPPSSDKVNVTVAVNGWCGCYKLLCARKAIEGLEHMVEFCEIGTPDHAKILHLGKVGGVLLDGEYFQPYELCTADALRSEIIRAYDEKRASTLQP
jgi:GNAT superfamily N-acetyltransferase